MRLEDPAWLREQARRCRRLASTTTDQHTANTLKLMAGEYEQKAVQMEKLCPLTFERIEPDENGDTPHSQADEPARPPLAD